MFHVLHESYITQQESHPEDAASYIVPERVPEVQGRYYFLYFEESVYVELGDYRVGLKFIDR